MSSIEGIKIFVDGDRSVNILGGEDAAVSYAVEDGAEFVVNEETGEVEVIALGDPSTTRQEVQLVTFDTARGTARILGGKRKACGRSAVTLMAGGGPGIGSNVNRVSRVVAKSAPALLRNSRRFQPDSGVSTLSRTSFNVSGRNSDTLPVASSSNYLAKQEKEIEYPTLVEAGTSRDNQQVRHAVILDQDGHETQEYVLLSTNESGEYVFDNKNSREIANAQHDYFSEAVGSGKIGEGVSMQQDGQTIIICQENESGDIPQFIQDADGNLIHMDGGRFTYEIEEGAVFSLDQSNTITIEASTPVTQPSNARGTKPKRKVKKTLQVIIGPDGKPVKRKGQTELRCMEKGCVMTCYNVSELRKHLRNIHSLHFDEEIITFNNEAEFKLWRETYERERMVSFIFRGGTKRIAKDQSVTYMICHRSGHYKPTMVSETQRKRRMKPQGSCKMGGYCTAGMKLLKNLDTGIIKMDICHTHYGHPLDSDAIPHLRVNPLLRKIILGKFQEGLSFMEVLAYIHHNPDRLEGLRLVDRRAVRNIFDTWKNPTRRSRRPNGEDLADLPPNPVISNICTTLEENHNDERNYPMAEVEERTETECNTETEESSLVDLPQLHSALESEEEVSQNVADESKDPPSLIRIESLYSLRSKRTPRKKKYVVPAEEANELSEEEPPLVIKIEQPEPPCSRGRYGLRPNRRVEVYRDTKQKSSPKTDDSKIKTNKATLKKGKVEVEDVEPVEKKGSGSTKKAVIEENEGVVPFLLISENLELAVDKLSQHGDSGPTVLLYKQIGKLTAKYGDCKRDLRRDDFCAVMQTPVQRQIMQMFPNIIGFEILDGPKSVLNQIKLAYLIVLDEYREAIPVAWLVTNSVEPRVLTCFYKAIKAECGDLHSKFFMGPKSSEAFQIWCSVFTESPQFLQNEVEVKRDFKQLAYHQFSTEKGRKEIYQLMEEIMHARDYSTFTELQKNIESLLDTHPTSGEFAEMFEKDWVSKAPEWALFHKIKSPVNIIGVSHCLTKLKKFISFKGTKNLNESFEHILKIGYDKCFLRSKRMFKGDQKYSHLLDQIKSRHTKAKVLDVKAIKLLDTSATVTYVVNVSSDKSYEVVFVDSPCECKLLCKYCNICVHAYVCTCNDFSTASVMCEHIHLIHCHRLGIDIDDAPEAEYITGDYDSRTLQEDFGKIETYGTEENPGATINIGDVLKAAGLFHRSDGLQPDQIVSIMDADTRRVIYEHHPCEQTVTQNPS